MIRRTQVTVTADGSAGASVGSANTSHVVDGIIRAIHLNYSASAAATLDVTISEANESPALPVLTVANNATDGWYYPMHQADNAGSGADLEGAGAPVVARDALAVAVAGANDNDTVTVTVVWDDGR